MSLLENQSLTNNNGNSNNNNEIPKYYFKYRLIIKIPYIEINGYFRKAEQQNTSQVLLDKN